MEVLKCPLCAQTVSESTYEKITGIWKEKEAKLKELRIREKNLKKQAANLTQEFKKQKNHLMLKQKDFLSKQKQKQEEMFLKKLHTQAERAKKERIKFESNFEKELGKRTKILLREERTRQREMQLKLKSSIEKSFAEKLGKAQSKIDKDRKALDKTRRLQKDRHEKLVKQYKSFEAKKEMQLESARNRIDRLEEQVRKGQSPQMLGLLEEKVFLEELKKAFPNDRFEHTGKGGDIVHIVVDQSRDAGTIVYELKKVARFQSAHVTQTQKAKSQRQADYGILVTNAKKPKSESGFFVSRGVIIIHPVGALVLIGILRSNLIDISKLKLSRLERDKTIKAVMEYVQGASFNNSINDIIQDTIDLYNNLKKEVVEHTKNWKLRYEKYLNINSNANQIDSRVIKLLASDDKRKKISESDSIKPISLHEEIK